MPAEPPLRTVLCEGTFLVRDSLVRLLRAAPDVELVEVCEDAGRLERVVDEHAPDVVITDTDTGGPDRTPRDCVRVVGRLMRSHPELAVVVLTTERDAPEAASLLAHGTERRAFLLRERVSGAHQLVSIIRSVARGGSMVDAKVVESLADPGVWGRDVRLDRLTPRERDVLERMARGTSNAGIARSLHLTKRAVERHVNAIFAKLGVPPSDDVSRRVRVVLLYLAATERVGAGGGSAAPRERPRRGRSVAP